MADYDLLRDHLRAQNAPELVLSFEEIGEILGFDLPRAAQRATWWDSDVAPDNPRPQRIAIKDGGYEATRLGEGKGVRFRKLSLPKRR